MLENRSSDINFRSLSDLDTVPGLRPEIASSGSWSGAFTATGDGGLPRLVPPGPGPLSPARLGNASTTANSWDRTLASGGSGKKARGKARAAAVVRQLACYPI